MTQHILTGGAGDQPAPPGEPDSSTPDLSAPPSRRLEVLVAVTALALSVLSIYLAGDIEVRGGTRTTLGPQWWPTILGIGAAALSVVLAVISITRGPGDRGETLSVAPGGLRRAGLTVVALVAYLALWRSPVGYPVATALFLVATMWVSGARSWRALVVFPVAITAFIVLLFSYLLRVPL